MTVPEVFIGVDVQVRRGCPFYAISREGQHLESGWLGSRADSPASIRSLLERLAKSDASRVAVGIDAPRAPLMSRREWSWKGKRGSWTPVHDTVGAGRHCEVVIAAHGLANPQWTPMLEAAPDWMRLGFELFAALSSFPHVYEVFPSAAYVQFAADRSSELSVCLSDFAPGPKDMLDAAVGALTVRDFSLGMGCEVGGGDGMGTIILPRPLGSTHASLHDWPGARQVAV